MSYSGAAMVARDEARIADLDKKIQGLEAATRETRQQKWVATRELLELKRALAITEHEPSLPSSAGTAAQSSSPCAVLVPTPPTCPPPRSSTHDAELLDMCQGKTANQKAGKLVRSKTKK